VFATLALIDGGEIVMICVATMSVNARQMSQNLIAAVRRGVALPIYTVALLLDFLMLYFLSAPLARFGAHVADDHWP
jgi:hypothetical protein